MSRFTLVGLLAWFASLVLYAYQAVSKVMERGAYSAKYASSSAWYDLSISNFFGPAHFAWVKDISFPYVGTAIEHVIHAQVYVLLFFFGILCFIIGMFRPD
jgi:hypothetical protein